MDVTYIHIPGYGWWYAVTVIDYYSRYLLACHLTSSYCAAEAIHALGLARAEAERLCGPLKKTPFLVTDNGSSFIAKRFAQHIEESYSHVRIQYRTPTQLGPAGTVSQDAESRGSLLAAVRQPGPLPRVPGGIPTALQRPSPPLGVDSRKKAAIRWFPRKCTRAARSIRIPRWQGWAKGAKEKLDRMLAEAA